MSHGPAPTPDDGGVAGAGRPDARRGRRGAGVEVDPARVRQARLARGLSLADLAGREVSRAFIHQVENGQARPSLEVLGLIADRTGHPLEYFTCGVVPGRDDLSGELALAARRVESLLREASAEDDVRREALRMVASSLRSSARVMAALSTPRP